MAKKYVLNLMYRYVCHVCDRSKVRKLQKNSSWQYCEECDMTIEHSL